MDFDLELYQGNKSTRQTATVRFVRFQGTPVLVLTGTPLPFSL